MDGQNLHQIMDDVSLPEPRCTGSYPPERSLSFFGLEDKIPGQGPPLHTDSASIQTEANIICGRNVEQNTFPPREMEDWRHGAQCNCWDDCFHGGLCSGKAGVVDNRRRHQLPEERRKLLDFLEADRLQRRRVHLRRWRMCLDFIDFIILFYYIILLYYFIILFHYIILSY